MQGKNTQTREWQLSDRQKLKLEEMTERELAITRGMIYNQLQEWKRKIYEQEDTRGLNVNGTAWKGMELTKGDIDFVNSQLLEFIQWEYGDKILIGYAEKLLKKLKSVSNPSVPQKALMADLEAALTVDGQPFV